jgi:iron(III) transport system ATP-binding protein
MSRPAPNRSTHNTSANPVPATTREAGAPATAVSLRQVGKAYGAHPVLEGLDLDIPAGALTAILGPSGCGKTTLLRLLAGFEHLDTGTITVLGRTVDNTRDYTPAEQRRIGYVPQEGGLFPHLSVAANVGFGLPRGSRRRRRSGQRRVDELLDLVGLSGLGQRRPHELSGGQQQRVALARALAMCPALVLLDEPFSALDAVLRAEVRADVTAALRETQTTGVLVTHDQDEALSIAEYVAVLHKGAIAQAATPESLYHQPADAWVARFVGAANLLPGHVHARSAHCALGELQLRTTTPQLPCQALVLIRPEQLCLTLAQPVPDGDAGTFQIATRAYHGHATILTLTPAPGAISHRYPNLIARAGADAPAIGALVTVAVHGPVVALPPDHAATESCAEPPVSANGH